VARRVFDEALENYLDDNLNAWQLQPGGEYRLVERADDALPHSAQASLLAKLCG